MGSIAAWLVHLYTALSAVFGVWALVAISQRDFPLAIALMWVTLIIDGTDGTLARAVKVRERIPWFDGRRLDDICDYFTYVLVPAYFLIHTSLLPHPAWIAFPVLASAYGFSRDDAKTDDHFFLGFPSLWNLIAMYLYILQWPAKFNLAILLTLSALVFVPIRYLYPSQTRRFRAMNVSVLSVWALAFCILTLQPSQDLRLDWVYASLVGPIYYVGISLWLQFTSARH